MGEREEERKVEVLREGLLDRSLDSDPAVSQASGSRTSRLDSDIAVSQASGLLDRSLDSDVAVSQASGSRTSRTSRQSDLGSLTGRFGAGAFYGASVLATAPTCPFPEEWQFNTIPESIENDDDID